MVIIVRWQWFVNKDCPRRELLALPGKERLYFECGELIIPDTEAVKGGH